MNEYTGVIVGRLTLAPHPTDPRLDVGRVAGRQVVTGRHYEEGQPGFFIPAGCVVPERLLREMWLWNDATRKGRLGGKRGDRVKARDWEGVRSEGLFYGAFWIDAEGNRQESPSWNPAWVEGQDVGEEVGIIGTTG